LTKKQKQTRRIKYENKMSRHKRMKNMKKWREKLMHEARDGDKSAHEDLEKYFQIRVKFYDN